MSKPLFITIEGIEGSGKTTNANVVVDHLKTGGNKVIHTREPGGTPIAEKIREILLSKNREAITIQTELLLIFAARSQHLHHVIMPNIKRGNTVICERFTDATMAYQGGGRGIDLELIKSIAKFVQQDFAPDAVLLFDVDVEISLARIRNRMTLDRIEQEKVDFFYKARQVYLDLAASNPERYYVIDANLEYQEVHKQIIKVLDKLLERKCH